jgi:hypothetical protein
MKMCGECRYYHQTETPEYLDKGECRYNPPVVIPIGNDDWITTFPSVEFNLGCGKWEPGWDEMEVSA